MAGNTSEKKKTKQSETLKKVFRHLGRYRIFVVFSILLATVSVALTLYIPKLTGYAVDYCGTGGCELLRCYPCDDPDRHLHADHSSCAVADECVQ